MHFRTINSKLQELSCYGTDNIPAVSIKVITPNTVIILFSSLSIYDSC